MELSVRSKTEASTIAMLQHAAETGGATKAKALAGGESGMDSLIDLATDSGQKNTAKVLEKLYLRNEI